MARMVLGTFWVYRIFHLKAKLHYNC